MPRLKPGFVCIGSLLFLGSIATLRSSVVPNLSQPQPDRRISRDSAMKRSEMKSSRHAMRRLTSPFFGLDVSRPFGKERETFDAEAWSTFCESAANQSQRLMVIQARGSKSNNPYADLLLKTAREKGMLTAGYVFLNFNRLDEPGDLQVREAVQAVGPEAAELSFMVVDVESGAAGSMTQAERVNRIGQAVEAVAESGLRPVIYAKNTGGSRGEWTDLTGNTDDFNYLPLWVPRYDYLPDMNSDGNSGTPWEPFGGWASRAGKQYLGDAFGAGGIQMDGNVFDPAILEGPAESRPYEVTGMLKITRGPLRKDVNAQWEQSVRVKNVSSTPVYGPLSLALQGLGTGAELANRAGTTEETLPLDSAYVQSSEKTFSPGESLKFNLIFRSADKRALRFEPAVLAGAGSL